MPNYEGVIWHLSRGNTTRNGDVRGPLWYRIHGLTVQRSDGGELWITSAAFGSNIALFLREDLPRVSALGLVWDEDLSVDEGL